MSGSSLHAGMRIFRQLVNDGDATTVARLFDVARTSPTATRLLLQLEATTTGSEDRDLAIRFHNSSASFFEPADNRIILNSAFRDSPSALVSLLGQEGTHALHRGTGGRAGEGLNRPVGPARPARPMTTRTIGSSASRQTSWWQCGSASTNRAPWAITKPAG